MAPAYQAGGPAPASPLDEAARRLAEAAELQRQTAHEAARRGALGPAFTQPAMPAMASAAFLGPAFTQPPAMAAAQQAAQAMAGRALGPAFGGAPAAGKSAESALVESLALFARNHARVTTAEEAGAERVFSAAEIGARDRTPGRGAGVFRDGPSRDDGPDRTAGGGKGGVLSVMAGGDAGRQDDLRRGLEMAKETGAQQVIRAGKQFYQEVVGAGERLRSVLAEPARVGRAFGVDKASPNSMATLQGSADLVMAKIGQGFVPLVERLSSLMQGLANSTLLQGVARGAGDYLSGNFAARALNAASFGGQWGDRAMEGLFGKPMRSMAGMPGAAIGTSESYYDAAVMSGLSTGTNTTEAALLRVQVEELQKISGLITRVEGAASGMAPPFSL